MDKGVTLMAGDIADTTLTTLIFDELKFDLTEQEFCNLQLRYRGEGNDNLALQVANTRYILRFHKHENETDVDEQQEDEKVKTSFAYYFTFIKPLFSTYCTVPLIAKVPVSEVQKLDIALLQLRPSHRREKRIFYPVAEIHPDYAFLSLYAEYLRLKKQFELKGAPMSNELSRLFSSDHINHRDFVYTLFTASSFSMKIINMVRSPVGVFCVEIKPKQAWSAVADRHAMCVYCMNQFLKLSTNKIRSRSKYCPLDLFSGNRIRMKNALMALIDEPQNNLKIFRNGELLYGDDHTGNVGDILQEWFGCDSERYADIFCHLITEALLSELAIDLETLQLSCNPYTKSQKHIMCPDLNMQIIEQNLAEKLQCLRESSLPENSILGRILQLQQLDESGIETVRDYFKTHESEFESEFSYVDRLISDSRIVDGRVEVPALNVVEAYLFSAAAKDLSILIAFERTADAGEGTGSYIIKDMENRSYKFNISVVDVGPKPVSCVRKHWIRDANVLKACAQYLCPESVMKA